MKLDERDIGLIVEKVVEQLAGPSGPSRRPATSQSPYSSSYRYRSHGDGGIYETIDQAIAAAKKAQAELIECSLKSRYAMVEAMRQISRDHLVDLSHRAVEETGLGREDDKIQKNTLVIEKTPGPEILEPWARSGDDGLVLRDRKSVGEGKSAEVSTPR